MKLPFQAPAPPPFYVFQDATQMPTAGAMRYGLVSELMAFRPLIGPAIGARYQFSTFFPTPGAYQAQSLAWQSGLTGVVHGQSALQPLSNPYG
jgi:hypothetical protein